MNIFYDFFSFIFFAIVPVPISHNIGVVECDENSIYNSNIYKSLHSNIGS